MQYKQKKNTYLLGRRTLAGSLTGGLLCLLILLAACGTNGRLTTATGGSISTATPGATKTPATRNCGTVHTMRLLIVPADTDRARGIEDCFWQAFQRCDPATMAYSQSNLDSGTIHNFVLKSVSGKCTITDGVQHFIAPHPPRSTTNTSCVGLTRQSDGLHFLSCGQEGNVLVPVVGAQ